MKVELIDFTGAPDLLAGPRLMAFTKQTRLNMTPGLFEEVKAWPKEKLLEEMKYMANTIPSSWEFMRFTWLFTGVTRAFTHQLVRTRTASYAQQTMRTLEMGGFNYTTGPSIRNSALREKYDDAMLQIDKIYEELVEDGAKPEDARGILPTNIQTNIVMGCDLRTLSGLCKSRRGPRAQDEYRQVVDLMFEEVISRWPFFEEFLTPRALPAILEIEKIAGIVGESKTFSEQQFSDRLKKAAHQLRSELG